VSSIIIDAHTHPYANTCIYTLIYDTLAAGCAHMCICYLCQLMPDAFSTDLSLHIHDRTLCQDILRCTDLGSLTQKRPRKVGYILFFRKLECNTLHMHCVCSMFTRHVFLACFCDVYILSVYGPLESGVDGTEQPQQALDAGGSSRSTSVQ